MRCTIDDIRQTAARPEQPGQHCLPLPGSHQCQAAAPVAPLASSEAAGHLQGGCIDSQGAGHSHSGGSQRPDTEYRPTYQHGLFVHPMLLVVPWTQTVLTRHAFTVAAPSIWTLYLLTLDCARAFPHSWKLICSDSLSPPVLQAPLYLRTSRRYTNVLLLLLLLISTDSQCWASYFKK